MKMENTPRRSTYLTFFELKSVERPRVAGSIPARLNSSSVAEQRSQERVSEVQFLPVLMAVVQW